MTDGRVVSLWRYPVKSIMGEELNTSELTERGLLGDRSLALIDTETQKVVSAKNPKKWPAMFDFRAAFTAPPVLGSALPPVRVTLPDGGSVSTDDARCAALVTRALGRPVQLASAAAASTFFDLAAVHVLTTATLSRLQQLYPQGRFEVRRFRPNIVVRPDDDDIAFVENAWVGRTLHIGDDVVVDVTDHCPRCVVTTLPQGDLRKDSGILRTAARHNGVHVGVYGEVRRGGRVQRGDTVRLG